jgi:hypothetical protein
MTRILVPTDFSEPSLAAVRYGIELATAGGVSSCSCMWSKEHVTIVTL